MNYLLRTIYYELFFNNCDTDALGLQDFHGGPGSLNAFITRYKANNPVVPIAFLANKYI